MKKCHLNITKNYLKPLPVAIGLLITCLNPIPGFSATPTPRLAPGSTNDSTADKVLGQLDFVHNTKNFVDGRGFSMDNTGDIVIDKSVTPNRVYATDRLNHRVLGWNNVTAFATHAEANIVIGQPDFTSSVANNGGVTASSLNFPTGVAVDSNGNLYIADANNHRVLYYKAPFTTDQAADDVLGQFGSFNTASCNGFGLNENSLCTPVRVALDAADNLYVSDQSNHRVLVYRTPQKITAAVPGSGDQTADRVFGQFGGFGTNSCNNAGVSANSLCTPVGITLDSAGNLYIADFSNHRVLEYNTPLTTNTTADKVYGQLNSFTANTCNNGGLNNKSLCNPISVTVAPDNTVFISERSNNRVLGYPNTGSNTANKVLGQFSSFNTNICNNNGGGSTTPVNNKSLCAPDGLAFDFAVSPDSPNLYVTDAFNHRILQYKPSATSGTNPTLIIKNGQAAQGVLGQTLFSTGVPNALDGRGFAFSDNNAGTIAIDKSVTPNRVYVADYSNHRVLGWNDIAAFTTHAQANIVIGQPNFFSNIANNGGVSSSSLNFPRGVAVDSNGNLFVADQNNHRILEYNTPFTSGVVADKVFGQSGSFVTANCNGGGVSANSLCTPVGLAVDSANNLYVGDFNNHRVLKFNGPLANQTADKVYGQTNSFTTATCNLGGVTSNSLCNPHGVAVDTAGNLYVTDASNNRALEFNALPATDTTADKVFGQANNFTTNLCNSSGITADSLCHPRFVSVNGAGHVFISDTDNHRVLKYLSPLTTNRTADRVFGQSNIMTLNGCKTLSPNSLCFPDGLAIDAANHLYTVDANSNRVLQYLAP